MPKPSSSLLHCIRTMAGVYRDDARNDAELLYRYAEFHDDAAFTTLTVRHGRMIWSICSRILGNSADAEDAYQTVLMTLASKAGRIRVVDTLGGWLYQVARRAALDVRKARKSRQKLQKGLQEATSSKKVSETGREEVYEGLYDEIARLSEKQRVVLVLHYLEGKTQAETAQILGVQESAVWDRLTRAKAILEVRLKKRGMVLGATSLGALLSQASSQGATPPAPILKATQAATDFRNVQLTDGIAHLARQLLKQAPASPPWWKTAWLVAIVCASGLGIGVGGIAWHKEFFGPKAEMPTVAAQRKTNSSADNAGLAKPRVDRYGDPLPSRALVRLGTVRLRHTVGDNIRVSSLAFTPDGKGIITAGRCNPPRLWDVITGKLIRRFGNFPGESVVDAVLSPNGRYLAYRRGSIDLVPPNQGNGSLYIWETATGKLVREFEGAPGDQYALSCAFSQDGRAIAARLHNKLGVWEVATGRELWSQETDHIQIVAFSSDGKVVASGSIFPKTAVVLRDADTGRKIRELGEKKGVQAISFRPDGDVVLQTDNCTLSLWDARSGKERWSRQNLYFHRLSPDGKTIMVRNYNSLIFLDAATGKELRRRGSLENPTFSPDGKVIAALSGSVLCFWNSETFRELPVLGLEGHHGSATSMGCMPDGETLVTGGADGAVRFWDLATGRERQYIWNDNPQQRSLGRKVSAMLSPDGKILAANFVDAPVKKDAAMLVDFFAAHKSRIRLWDVADGKELRCSSIDGITEKLIFSSDGNWLAAAVQGYRPLPRHINAHIWNVATGEKLDRVFPGMPLWLSDNNILITAKHLRQKLNINFWSIETGKRLHQMEVALVGLPAVFSDGRMLGYVSQRSNIPSKISIHPLSWGPAPSSVVIGTPRVFECTDADWACALAFSPDSKVVATSCRTSNGVIRLWEVDSGKEWARFSGHLGPVTKLCFTADGRKLISGSEDSTLLVWDLTSRMQEDGRLRPVRYTEGQLDDIWKELGSNDAAIAFRALWALVADQSCVTFLGKRLRPVEVAAVPEIVDQLITQLDSNSFQVRMRAYDSLAKLGEQGEPSLRKALETKRSADSRSMLQTLLTIAQAKRDWPPADILQNLRTIEVLEHIGTRDAVRVLQKCAAGAAGARLTLEAGRALGRLEQMHRHKKEKGAVAKKFQS